MSKQTITVLDWLIHKPVTLTIPESIAFPEIEPGSFVVYKDDEGKELVGEYLGYPLKNTKKGTFSYPLNGTELTNFNTYQETAKQMFEVFKKEFKQLFPESVPLQGRMNLQGNHVYFYFFADTRFNFADFVREFRSKISKKFFIYQVGARDRVRLHPNKDEWFDPSGLPLSYSIFKHPLGTVDSDVISLQHLDGRDPEKLKDRSGKLDHSLTYEKDLYVEEMKQYPSRGSVINYNGQRMRCVGTNILTQEIKLRGKNEDSDDFRGEWLVITLDEYKKNSTTTPKENTRPQLKRPTREQVNNSSPSSTQKASIKAKPARPIRTNAVKKTSTRPAPTRPKSSSRPKSQG